MIQTYDFLVKNIRPDKESYKIEFLGEINGATVKFDPFVSCHLKWYDGCKWIGKSVKFNGWRSESGCYLVHKVLEVIES